MSNMNKAIVQGNLTADPDIKTTGSGSLVAHFTVASNESWKGKDGEKKERTLFLACECWGKLAEIVENYLERGSHLLVDGKLRLDEWEKDGQKHQRMKLAVDNLYFLGRGEQKTKAAEPELPAPQTAPQSKGDDDNLPF